MTKLVYMVRKYKKNFQKLFCRIEKIQAQLHKNGKNGTICAGLEENRNQNSDSIIAISDYCFNRFD